MVWPGGALEAALVRGRAGAPAPAPAPLTPLQAEGWRLLAAEWAGDGAAQAAWLAAEAGRAAAQPDAAALARAFAAGGLSLEAFREQFDRGVRGAWAPFGLRGPAGAMFLNRLVKHALGAARAPELDVALRAVLPAPAPDAVGDATARLAAFARYVGDRGPAPQPGLAVGFAAAWWALQAPRAWPAYAPAARRVLEAEEGVFAPAGEPAADYLAFRAAALLVCDATGLHPWALEALCRWHERRLEGDAPPVAERLAGRRARRPVAPARRPGRASDRAAGRVAEPAPAGCFRAADRAIDRAGHPEPDPDDPRPRRPQTPTHTEVQWVLARLGRQLGCQVWIAANDHGRRWRGERLGSLSVDRLPPLALDPDSQRLVELVDVVWLRGRSQVAAAFEVERSTSVHSGLLRMADLAALAPNLAVPLYVVAPAARLDKVRRELRRPAMRALALDRRCGFFSAEALVVAAPDLARWATGPGAVDRLAERVDSA